MLKIHPVQKLSEKKELLKQFNPMESTWVVSDLQAKQELQHIWLPEYGVLDEISIFRASELWMYFLKRSHPSIKIVSSDLMITTIKSWLTQATFEGADKRGLAKELVEYVGQLLPILVHPNGKEHVTQWLKEDPSRFIRIGHWLELADWTWEQAKIHKMIPMSWATGILAATDFNQIQWQRNLFFDLSVALTGLEAELIHSLSGQVNCHVIQPVTPNSMTRATDYAYHFLYDKTGIKKESFESPVFDMDTKDFQFLRFSSELAEVKQAVGQVRQWADQGVPLHEISIIAPEMENIWLPLSRYLDKEGLSTQKKSLFNLMSLPSVSSWLSRLRVHSGSLSHSELEFATYYDQDEIPLKFDEFKQLFSLIYNEEDIQRHSKIQDLYDQQSPEGLFRRDEFITWSLKKWSSKYGFDDLTRVYKKLLGECPVNLELSLGLWVQYLETLCARVELEAEDSSNEGIHCLNLRALDWLSSSHIIFMGLSMQNLNDQVHTAIQLGDVEKMYSDLGFSLDWPEKDQMESLLEWNFRDGQWEKAEFYFSESDLSGKIQSPSLFWLLHRSKLNPETESKEVPYLTRWDSIQRSSMENIAKINQWSRDDLHCKQKRILQDLGVEDIDPIFSSQKISLSATQLENYSVCPFKFVAEKYFKLSDLQDVDLDLDNLTKGRLIHLIFEQLTEEPFQTERSDEEIRKIIFESREKIDFYMADETLWPAIEEKYLKLARRFLENEKFIRESTLEPRTIGREIKIQAQWDTEKSKFTPLKGEAVGIRIRGSIDRVDRDKDGKYYLYDYKSSGSKVRGHGKWEEMHLVQLPLYATLIEQGLTELDSGEVVSALYYVAKTMEANKGYVLKEYCEALPQISARSGSKIENEKKNEILNRVELRFSKMVNEIKSGNLGPDPDLSLQESPCIHCQWSRLCRAKHLN